MFPNAKKEKIEDTWEVTYKHYFDDNDLMNTYEYLMMVMPPHSSLHKQLCYISSLPKHCQVYCSCVKYFLFCNLEHHTCSIQTSDSVFTCLTKVLPLFIYCTGYGQHLFIRFNFGFMVERSATRFSKDYSILQSPFPNSSSSAPSFDTHTSAVALIVKKGQKGQSTHKDICYMLLAKSLHGSISLIVHTITF